MAKGKRRNFTPEFIVKPKNKETFSPPLVGEVCNLAVAACRINSKLYYKAIVILRALRGESSQAELGRHHNLSEDQLSK